MTMSRVLLVKDVAFPFLAGAGAAAVRRRSIPATDDGATNLACEELLGVDV